MPSQVTTNHVQSHLAKSQQFLLLAEVASDDPELRDSVVSLCVSSGIHSSDAVLAASGHDGRGRRNHDQAPTLLRKRGHDTLANALARLLKVKWKAQYSPNQCSAEDARTSLTQAKKMFELATIVCNQRMNE